MYNRITEEAALPKLDKQLSYPKNFTRVQKDFCKKLIDQLYEAKLISNLDVQLAFKYCRTKFLMDSVEDKLLKVEVGSKQFAELTKTYNSLANTFIRISKELGLSPRGVRNKAKLDEREVLDTNIAEDDNEIDMEGWKFEDDED